MFGSLSTKIAHSTITPALGNQDLRFLQESINKEKELVTSVQKLSKDLGTAAEALKQWAAGEGEDLSDVASGSMIISTHIISALNVFAEHEANIRSQLKDVRTKEEQLDELRRRRKAVASKLEAQEKRLSKMGSENKGLSTATEQLSSLQNELRQLDTSILVDMARLSDHKRHAMRTSLIAKFGGLAELGEKMTIIGELGKLIAAEVPQDVTPPGQGRAPYPGREAVVQITAEAARCVAGVAFNGVPDAEFASRPARPRPQALAPPPEGGIPPNGMTPHAASEHDHGPGGSRFTDTASSMAHPPYTPSSVHGGTMPPSREYSTITAGPPPVDEFGRPIDGLPISANTMPALGAKQQSIQQMPLSTIQNSMRSPHSPGGPNTFVPSHNATGSSGGSRSGFVPPGGSSRPVFHAPPPPPAINLPQHHAQDPRGAPGQGPNNIPNQDPSASRFNQYPQGRQGATVERGLTLSLPLSSRRSPSPAIDPSENNAPEEKEVDSPFVPPAGNAPSSFKPPQQPIRQGTQGSGDVVLGSGEVDLQRTTTLPPKLGFGGDFPEWSLGFEDLGLGGDLEGKKDAPVAEKEAEPKVEKKTLPEAPSAPPAEPEDRSPISAVPKSLREQEGGSQASTPITQTPTTYSNTQTPTTYTPASTSTGPDGLKIVHDHVVDNPSTRTSGNSGRFAMFPDKRKPTPQSSLDRADSTNNSSLMPPHTKTSTHPGTVDRTPSPYPEGVSPVPTPAEEKQSEELPLDIAAFITHPEFEEPGGLLAPAPKKSILVDPQHSRTDTMGSSGAGPNSAASHDSHAPRLRFAPRPPSPITPSPVTPGNPAWASIDSLDRSGAGSSSDLARAPVTEPSSTPGYMEAGSGRSEQASASGGTRGDNRLSIITPLEVHKKEGGSHPSTPNHGATLTRQRSEMSEEQFNAMLDSFSAQVGSPSSNPPSGFISANDSSFSSGPNASSRSNEDDSFNQAPSHVKNFLASSGGYDSSRGSSSGAQESSLDTSAAVAGSPFSSPTPTSQAPAPRSFKLADMPPRTVRGDMDGNFAGVGTAHRRVGSGDSGYSDSAPTKISAGAFRRGPAAAAAAGTGASARSSPAVSPVPSPRQSYQSHTNASSQPISLSTPRQDYRSVSPPTSVSSGHGGQQSTYYTPQATPNPVPGDRNSLPPGAAAPSRLAGPPGAQPGYQQQPQRNPQWTGGGTPDMYVQGRASPTLTPSPVSRIPASLMPGRPGSASPLAPIGHTHPPPISSGYMSQQQHHGPGGYVGPGHGPGQQGYAGPPPWQQQQQQGYRSVSPGMAESVAHEDAYGGVEMEGPAPTGGQWGGHGAYGNAAPRYGGQGGGSWSGH